MKPTCGYFKTQVELKRQRSNVWAGFYLHPETENYTKIIYSYHSITQGRESKKRLENMRHICLPVKPHTSHQAIQRYGLLSSSYHVICSGPLFSVILSFPWWEMILSLCSCPDVLSAQGPVDLCGFFPNSNMLSLMVSNITLFSLSYAPFLLIWVSFSAVTAIFQWVCL